MTSPRPDRAGTLTSIVPSAFTVNVWPSVPYMMSFSVEPAGSDVWRQAPPSDAGAHDSLAVSPAFNTTSAELTSVTLSPGVTVARGDLIAIYEPGPSACGGIGGGYGPAQIVALNIDGNYMGGTLPTGSLEHGSRYGMRASAGAEVLVGVLPVVGFAQGSFGSVFRTDFQIANVGNLALHATKLVFHPGGVSASPSDPSTTISLPQYSTNTGDLLAAMGATGVGSLDIYTQGEYAPRVSAHIYNDAGAAGTSGRSDPAGQPAVRG